MRTLYTIAYPTLAAADFAFINEFRHQHDLPYRDVVRPHFTQVFGCRDIAEPDYLDHVAAVAKASQPINFVCRYAMLGADHALPIAHVFLLPDEGHSALSLQHDQLYTGALARHLRLDIPFTPHITIGTLDDRVAAKALCDGLNRDGLNICGQIGVLTVAALEDGKILDIAGFTLGM